MIKYNHPHSKKDHQEMNKHLQISLATGHVFEIPVKVLAEDRAAHLLLTRPDEFQTTEAAATATEQEFSVSAHAAREWFLGSTAEAATDMLSKHGRLIAFNPPAIDWSTAAITSHDERANIAPIAPTAVMAAPVEMVVSQMAQDNELCSALTMNGQDDGQPHQAIVFLRGGPLAINTFMTVLCQVADHLSAQMQAATPQDLSTAATSPIVH